jgi:hypothetical protein
VRIIDPDQAGYFFGAGLVLIGIVLAIVAVHHISRKS